MTTLTKQWTKHAIFTRREMLWLSVTAMLSGRVWGGITDKDRKWGALKLPQLSLAERVGQLMSVHNGIAGLQDGVRAGKAGSLQVPRGGETTAKDVVDFNNEIQSLARVPLLTIGAVEAGMGQIAREATLFPNNMAIGATWSEDLAYAAGQVIAREARALGIVWPGVTVADVNSNPLNPIINTRSFGDSPEQVTKLLLASIRGVQDERLISSANHFPGHGGTSQDSHLELPTVDRSREELDRIDLPPFRAAIDAGVATMCTAHICYPALEADEKLPATMSKAILTRLLRDEFGFEGFIHSDSFAMDAIRKNFSIADAAVQSVRAGCDIILSYPDWDECFDAVLAMAEKDDEIRFRVDQSAQRLLTWKHWVGLIDAPPIDLDNCLAVLSKPEHKKTAATIARNSMTAVRGEEFLKSLSNRDNILCVVGRQRRPDDSYDHLLKLLKERWPRSTVFELDVEPADEQVRELSDKAKIADAVVFLGFTEVRNHDPESVRFPQQ
ncbi:MAG: hypothetical protein O2955_14890, partial [Planctomycetota bacterium]|nr:hypothetical protein [Planctomycetota bacterium]